ncbi:hypothetical protein [Paenibacillus sp. IITD108]|uniref:hypothetical protein n=1 Tax=Paenibacillus sp. IITD108 TaxID=3116649 RepID=UPI002F4086A4
MWTKQLKDSAIEMANSKQAGKPVITSLKISYLSQESKKVLEASFANSKQQKDEKSDPFWG